MIPVGSSQCLQVSLDGRALGYVLFVDWLVGKTALPLETGARMPPVPEAHIHISGRWQDLAVLPLAGSSVICLLETLVSTTSPLIFC